MSFDFVSGVLFKIYELNLFTPFKFHINIAFWKVGIFPFCQGDEKKRKTPTLPPVV